MTNKQKSYSLLKFSGSLSLLLTITGILLAVGGQLEFLGNERKHATTVPIVKSVTNNTDKPKYSFYDELKKRKTELEANGKPIISVNTATVNEKPSDKYRYVVQVGAFSRQADANKVKKRVENLGYPARVVTNGRKFLAQAGPFEGKNNAQTVQNRLRSQKMDTLLKRLK